VPQEAPAEQATLNSQQQIIQPEIYNTRMLSFAQPIAATKGVPGCASSIAKHAVRQQSYLVSIRIAAFSKPQPQELFVNALWLFVLCVLSFISFLYPVPACSPLNHTWTAIHGLLPGADICQQL
jgi:hypothetical protein